MSKYKLNYKQNLCAARIFLNTFGFVLGESNEIDETSSIKIFNKNSNEAGFLSFDNGKVLILANYSNAVLTAYYDTPKIFGFKDTGFNKSSLSALFTERTSKISFTIDGTNRTNLSGVFLITSSMNTEFGVNCVCHPLICVDNFDGKRTTLKMLRNGLMFGLETQSRDYFEKIEVRPFDELNGFFLHDVRIGCDVENNYSYLSRKYSGIFNGAVIGEDSDKLHVFLQEEKCKRILNFYNNFVLKNDKGNSRKLVI